MPELGSRWRDRTAWREGLILPFWTRDSGYDAPNFDKRQRRWVAAVMKILGEILLNYREDPEKEALRLRLNEAARSWEESDPAAQREALALRSVDLPEAEVGEELQPLLRRVLAALPQMDVTQRRMLEMLLDSWGM